MIDWLDKVEKMLLRGDFIGYERTDALIKMARRARAPEKEGHIEAQDRRITKLQAMGHKMALAILSHQEKERVLKAAIEDDRQQYILLKEEQAKVLVEKSQRIVELESRVAKFEKPQDRINNCGLESVCFTEHSEECEVQLESADRRGATLAKEKGELEAQNTEMRWVLHDEYQVHQVRFDHRDQHRDYAECPVCRKYKRVLSTEAGRGWLSPEKAERLRKLLRRSQIFLTASHNRPDYTGKRDMAIIPDLVRGIDMELGDDG